ncbi:ATP-grasp domain-containing protein [Paracraurococcus ruber]|uniref:ATP-grasp domain-containing protein n=1 Tax=Paracraurococcus ruber TaxID=77675 RepID=UPI0013053709|nr:ATP-grasp domain-containing protein [Paracraurococcus ruber]
MITGASVRLAEHDGKALLARHGVPIPRGALLHGAPPADAAGVLKAQVLEGGRGRRGLVRRAAPGEAPAIAAAIRAALGDAAAPLLLEEEVPMARELYLAARVDGTAQRIEILCAPEGGVEVEQAAMLLRCGIEPEAAGALESLYAALRRGLPPDLAARVARFGLRLARILRAEDLELLEVNPLGVLADGRLVACDAKAVRDDAAQHRRDSPALSATLEDAALTPLERRARDQGFHLVELPGGTVAMVTAGAGLGMLMLDLLADAGCTAACFMDNLNGGPAETMPERLALGFEIARRPEVKAVMFFTTIASRGLEGRVAAIAAALRDTPPPKPFLAGIAAGHAALRGYPLDQARADLAAAGVTALHDTPQDLVRAVAAVAQA